MTGTALIHEIEKQPRMADCDCCGTAVRWDDMNWLETHGDVCSECYDAGTTNCQLCGEDSQPSQVSPYILVKNELAETADRLPGIYRILGRPFLSIPLIGSGSIDGSEILFVDRLPQRDSHYDISGNICAECAQPFEQPFRAGYGNRHPKALRKMSFGWRRPGLRWKLEKDHILATVKACPEMLLDLECDADDRRWKDLAAFYQLPAAKTWHDWLLFEHAGVKIYSPYGPERGLDSWLVLRPEPKFRSDRNIGNFLFCASGLPTWESPADYSPYDTQRLCRQAIVKAIDQRILRQDGTFGPDGQPIYCR